VQGSPNREYKRSKGEMACVLMPLTHHCDEKRDEERYWGVEQHHHTTRKVVSPGDHGKHGWNEPEMEYRYTEVERRYSPVPSFTPYDAAHDARMQAMPAETATEMSRAAKHSPVPCLDWELALA
jgi:hypothetical protein